MDRSKMDRANALFASLQKESSKLSESQIEQEAVRAKTKRLRALRLARDAADPARRTDKAR